MNKDGLYASTSLEMLKALFEKIELHRNRKNLSPIEKNNALYEALYQENETDSLYVIRSLRYQSTETRPIRSHLNSCQVKDAVQKSINAAERLLKEVMIPARFFKGHRCSRLTIVSVRALKSVKNIHHINEIIRLKT